MADLKLFVQQSLVKLFNDRILNELSRTTGFNVKFNHIETGFWECYRAEREQFDAGCILEKFRILGNREKAILVSDVDLFLPIFTFVFGLAQLGGEVGIVSIHRLKNEYYGLPKDEELLIRRLIKEIVHEFGHLLGLKHCPNYLCVMASSNTADGLDVKGDEYCSSCNEIVSL